MGVQTGIIFIWGLPNNHGHHEIIRDWNETSLQSLRSGDFDLKNALIYMNSITEKEFVGNQSSKWLPLIILALWFLALGSFLWPACSSPQPPLYDAVSYAEKAKNVWVCIAEGKFMMLLATPPSIRPPGTVLMSYPFGYSENTQGFYFRSIFIPSCLLGIANYIAAMAAGFYESKRGLFAVLIAICATTLPLFYQFHLSGSMFVAYRGLVDGFIGSVSGLAAALLLYSSATKKHRLVKLVALSLAALSIYIKPAGMLIFGICAGMYLLQQGIWTLQERQKINKNLLLDIGLVVLAGSLMIPAFLSPYLGPANMASGEVAVGILKKEMFPQITGEWSLKAVFHLLGWIPAFLLILALVAGFFGLCRQKGRERIDLIVLLLFVMIWFTAGLAFLLQSSIEQVRYAFPFWLPAIVCVTALAFRAKCFVNCKPLVVAVCGLVVIQTANLLDQIVNYQDKKRPSILAGWNTRDVDVPELAPFYEWLSSQSIKHRRKKILYDAAVGNTSTVLGSAIYYDSAVAKRYQKGGFYLERRAPINWVRPSGVYLKELADVDFILTNPFPISPGNSVASQQLAKFQNGVVKSPSGESGLSLTRLGSTALIYEVVDREKFLKWLSATLPADS
jgi:hypothetical protein